MSEKVIESEEEPLEEEVGIDEEEEIPESEVDEADNY